MKKNILAVLALLGLGAATTLLVTVKNKKAKNQKKHSAVDAQAAHHRNVPKGRHTMVRKRIQELPV